MWSGQRDLALLLQGASRLARIFELIKCPFLVGLFHQVGHRAMIVIRAACVLAWVLATLLGYRVSLVHVHTNRKVI